MAQKAYDNVTLDNHDPLLVFKALSASTSKLLTDTIVQRFGEMRKDIQFATKPFKAEELEALKVEALVYEQDAISAMDVLQGECKKYKPTYKPQASGARLKINDACKAVVTAADEALEKLKSKVQRQQKKSHLNPQSAPLPVGSYHLGSYHPVSSSLPSSSVTHPSAMVVDTPLATTAQWRTIPAEPRDSAEKAAELAAAVKAKEDAQREQQRLQHQLDIQHNAEKINAKYLAEMEKMKATMVAQSEQLQSKLAATEKTLARNEGSLETQTKLQAELDQLRGALGEARVEKAYCQGAIIGSMGGLSGAGPSGAGLNPGNHLASLMMPQAQPPNRPSLMPPPPTPPNYQLQLKDRGQESKVRPDLQPLIEELTQAEDKAVHPPANTVAPNYVVAKACCDWKEALTKLDVSIASLEAKLLMDEEKLAVDMSTARQWLDALPR